MKCLVFVLSLSALGLTSCDKAKKAVDAARDKIEGSKDAGLPKAPGGDVESALVSQVDTAAEGVRFRRDLPFPSRVEVPVVERVTFHNTRRIVTSALGTESMVANGTFEVVGLFERDGPRVSFKIDKMGPVADPKEAVEKAKAKAEGAPPEEPNPMVGVKVEFVQTANGWQLPPHKGAVDFNRKVLEQSLLPHLSNMVQEFGGLPRTQWFSSSRRWIAGDKLVLEGASLALLFDAGTTGKVTLTYEVSEALDGHPCGRFAVQGDISIRNEMALDGGSRSGELTIQSGKIWCSLLHPLILREDLQTLKTVTEGQGNGPKTKLQGAIDELKIRQWKNRTE